MLSRQRTREILEIAAMLLLLLAARSSLADHYYIPSGSMEHTLLEGDRVLVDKRAYGLRVPFTRVTLWGDRPAGRGDVAIFDSPTDGERLIKRIVAVAGDEVLLRRGRLTINGQLLADPFDVEDFGRPIRALEPRAWRRSRCLRRSRAGGNGAGDGRSPGQQQ